MVLNLCCDTKGKDVKAKHKIIDKSKRRSAYYETTLGFEKQITELKSAKRSVSNDARGRESH
ncbi:MAG: hypothetical protein RR370_02195, partial [Synergistaceae bacterium]